MITQESDETTWSRLKVMWESEGKPGYVILGGTHYQVFTPNGDDAPQFLPNADQSLYSTTSTGISQAGNSKTKTPTARQKSK